MKKTLLLLIIILTKPVFAQTLFNIDDYLVDDTKVCNENITKQAQIEDTIKSYSFQADKDGVETLLKFTCLINFYYEKNGLDATNTMLAALSIPNKNINIKHSLGTSGDCITPLNIYDALIDNIGDNFNSFLAQYYATIDESDEFKYSDISEIKNSFVGKATELIEVSKNNFVVEASDLAKYIETGSSLDLANLKLDESVNALDSAITELSKVEPLSTKAILKEITEFYKGNNNDGTKLVKETEFVAKFKGKINPSDKDQIIRLLNLLTAINLKASNLEVVEDAINKHNTDLLNKKELAVPIAGASETDSTAAAGLKVDDLAKSVKDGIASLPEDFKLDESVDTLDEAITELKTKDPVASSDLLKEVADFYNKAENRDADGVVNEDKFLAEFKGQIKKEDMPFVRNLLNTLTAISKKIAAQTIDKNNIDEKNFAIVNNPILLLPAERPVAKRTWFFDMADQNGNYPRRHGYYLARSKNFFSDYSFSKTTHTSTFGDNVPFGYRILGSTGRKFSQYQGFPVTRRNLADRVNGRALSEGASSAWVNNTGFTSKVNGI